MSAVMVRSPLERIAAARANGFGLAVHAGPLRAPGWHDARALAEDAQLRADLLTRAHAATSSDLYAVAIAWVLEKHAWHAASLVVASLLVDGTLPPLHRAQLFHGESGWADAIAVPPTEWEHGDATDAARALDAHLSPVIDALAPRRAARALWREAGDRVGQAVLWCGEAFGAREHAWSIGAQLLSAPTRLRAPAGFRLEGGAPFRQRTGCCLAHRAPEGVACADCLLAAKTRAG